MLSTSICMLQAPRGCCSRACRALEVPQGLSKGSTDLQAVLPLVVEGEALRCALALIVAAALADAVHIAPVRFCLGVLQRVSIHLKETNAQPDVRATLA